MKILQYLFAFLSILILTDCTLATKKIGDSISSPATYNFEELERLLRNEKRPIAVFLHAEWCKFCKNMEQNTFSAPEVINRLNKDYYFVSFDGEYKEDVNFKNHVFKYVPKGNNSGVHSLAESLGSIDGELAFPTFLLMNPDFEIIFQHNAFLNENEIIEILKKGIVTN